MTYSLGAKSRAELKGVHPDFVPFVERTLELSEQDFGVHYGLRSEAQQREYVRTGASQTMDSRHRKQADGWGHAGDLVPFINGKTRTATRHGLISFDCFQRSTMMADRSPPEIPLCVEATRSRVSDAPDHPRSCNWSHNDGWQEACAHPELSEFRERQVRYQEGGGQEAEGA